MITLASLLLLAATPAPSHVIIIDLRNAGCSTSSRIAEGQRRMARIEAGKLYRSLRRAGHTPELRTIERNDPADASVSGTLVKVNCG